MKKLILLITILALLVAACGSGDVGDAGPVTPGHRSETTTTTTHGAPTMAQPSRPRSRRRTPTDDPAEQLSSNCSSSRKASASRSSGPSHTPLIATNAIRALIEGPTPTEQDTELSTAIPADTLLLGLTIDDGLATIDLSREFEVGGGSFNILSRLAQVVYTLTQFDTVDEVLLLDGEPVTVFSGEGVLLENPVGRDDYATILPIDPWSRRRRPRGARAISRMSCRTESIRPISGASPSSLPTTCSTCDRTRRRVPDRRNAAARGCCTDRSGGDRRIVGVGADRNPAGRILGQRPVPRGVVPPFDFETITRVASLLAELGDIIATDGDLRAVVSQRGLYVSHHAAPIRFSLDELDTILTDPTTYKWPSNALGPDELDEVPGRTFAEAVADSFLSAYDDPDTVTTVNEPLAGGNGRLPEYAIPFEFESFNYIGVFDPIDNPDFGGLDWITWYVSIDYEDGSPVIVGMTVDMWAP